VVLGLEGGLKRFPGILPVLRPSSSTSIQEGKVIFCNELRRGFVVSQVPKVGHPAGQCPTVESRAFPPFPRRDCGKDGAPIFERMFRF